MRYKVYEIAEDKPEIIYKTEPFEVDSTLFNSLSKYHFTFINSNEEEPDLIFFLANRKNFWHLTFLHKLLQTEIYFKVGEDASQKFWLRPDTGIHPTETTTKPTGFKPVIIIYSEDSFLGMDDRKIRFGIQYWDTCIWQRWVNIGRLNSGPNDAPGTFAIDLDNTLKEIKWYHDMDLYGKPVSLEYCDFVTRLYRNSFLIDFDEQHNHANYVTPFPFFRESSFRRKNEKLWGFSNLSPDKKFFKQKFKNIVWRVLLIDDDANKTLFLHKLLSNYFYEENSFFSVVIDQDTEERIDVETLHPEGPVIVLEQAKTISQAKKLMSERAYDIILLDYLLGNKENSPLERETGMDFLDELLRDKDKLYHKSITQRFWIFLTSSYPTAFIDAIRNKGHQLTNDIWMINRGAHPLHSPNYFLYSFSKFLQTQVEEFISKESENIKSTWNLNLLNLKHNINSGGPDEPDEYVFTRGWANKTLSKILNYWNKIDSLKDISQVSLLAQSFLKSDQHSVIMKEYDSGLYGYIIHLLFLFSYSEGFEWEQMKANLELVKELTLPESQGIELMRCYDVLNKRIISLKDKHDQE